MRKILFLTDYVVRGGTGQPIQARYVAGETYEVSEGTANHCISRGLAISAEVGPSDNTTLALDALAGDSESSVTLTDDTEADTQAAKSSVNGEGGNAEQKPAEVQQAEKNRSTGGKSNVVSKPKG